MSDERPLSLKRKERSLSADRALKCIVHFDSSKDNDIRSLSDSQMEVIRRAAARRQCQTNPDTRFDDICESLPIDFNPDIHGHHIWCYKKFTNVSRLVVKPDDSCVASQADTPQQSARRSSRQAHSCSQTVLFPQDKCMFCSKASKYLPNSHTRERLVRCETDCGEALIKEAATARGDFVLLGQVADMNLAAREARYHESCRRSYVRPMSEARHQAETLEDDELSVSQVRAANKDAFEFLCQHVNSEIVEGHRVERMTMLKDRYLSYMQEKYPLFYNDQYSTQKLKLKMTAHFGDKLRFWLPHAASKSELVFSSSVDVGEAVDIAFESSASDSRILDAAAEILHRQIKESWISSPEVSWPPSDVSLKMSAVAPPATLVQFIQQTVMGKKSEKCSERVSRLSSSISEDICVAATQGQWAMPKHILLSMSVRHLTGSAEVISILNRYGHCQCYSKLLELETALANQITVTDSVLPSNISTTANIVSHLCWDNFDVQEATPSGHGTTHSTHGIMIQEVDPDIPVSLATVTLPKTKQRSFKHVPAPTPTCYPRKKVEPPISVCQPELHSGTVLSSCGITKEETLWSVCRCLYNSKKTVPDWSGWLSKTAAPTCSTLSSVGYMTPIFTPATDYATVFQCLQTSVDATSRVQQQYTFITFDLAMAKIAYSIVWDQQVKFGNVVVHLGAFHTMCAYMSALGKMMTGSGFEDIVIESGICASGSIQQVMNGKHYNRAMRVHHHMLDAVMRLLIQAFVEELPADNRELPEIVALAECPSQQSLVNVCTSSSCSEFLSSLDIFMQNVRKGERGKTAQFWLSYADCVWILLRFLQSVKENNLQLFVSTLRQLCPLLFAGDRLNYARYVPMYHAQLSNLSASHPGADMLLDRYGISVSRSNVPGCRNPIDLTIEQTINKSAKTAGGVIGFTRNVNAYQRWCLIRHRRASFLEATLDLLDMTQDTTDVHKTTRPAEMRKSEDDVSSIVEAFQNFINPFQMNAENADNLYCLSSGQPATEVVCTDLMNYLQKGEHAAVEFVNTRLVARSVSFHDTMKKLNLKTFASMSTTKTLTTTQKKVVQVKAERNLLGQLLLWSKDHDLNFEKLFTYPLSPVPWSLATADGCFVKTNKAQLMHVLEAEAGSDSVQIEEVTDNVVVMDGNAVIQSLVHLPETFGQLALMIFNCLPKAKSVHFVTDSYHDDSIKNVERSRRGCSSTLLIGGPSTKMPHDFGAFLRNAENKRQLVKFILEQWQLPAYAPKLTDRTVYIVCGEKCYSLMSVGNSVALTEVPEMHSSQEEADTRVILHCLYESHNLSQDDIIIVRSPDTDVLVLLLYYCGSFGCTVVFDTGVGIKRRLVPVNNILEHIGQDVAAALPGFHAFTGSDCTSAFVRKGKKTPYRTMKQNSCFIDTFCNLGSSASSISVPVRSELEHFVCTMYGCSKHTRTNEVRSHIFQARYGGNLRNPLSTTAHIGIDLSLLPPCSDTLTKHCQRANYQTFIWRNAHVQYPELPSPVGNGWIAGNSGKLEIHWTDDSILPQSILDIVGDMSSASEDDDGEQQCVEEDDEVDNMIDMIFEDDVEAV